jgi:hypothetical protein
MISEPDSVRSAVAQPPVLHRYREKLPDWLVSAARIVASNYYGDVSRLWSDNPTAAELRSRFDRFPGIGQKKAAMAVEILERDLGIPSATCAVATWPTTSIYGACYCEPGSPCTTTSTTS